MRRAPWVVAATGAGLGLVLTFHTRPVTTSQAISSAATSGKAPSPGSTGTGGSGGSDTRPPSTSRASVSSPTTAGGSASAPTTAPSNTRSATSEDVQYRYGDLELKVTEKGTRITNIQILANDAPDPRSQQINSQAVPMLQSEALSAQSANIDGVSGATFTTEAYVQALQSALDQLES